MNNAGDTERERGTKIDWTGSKFQKLKQEPPRKLDNYTKNCDASHKHNLRVSSNMRRQKKSIKGKKKQSVKRKPDEKRTILKQNKGKTEGHGNK